jgi:hypothetical protein
MWKRHLWIRIVHVSSFILLKTQYFFKNNYKIGLLKSKIRAKNVNKYRAVVSLLLLVMSVMMAPYWGKGGILWLSYLLNEFGDPDIFVRFYFKYIINSMPGKFQHILISGTITAELPCVCRMKRFEQTYWHVIVVV